jgi:FKBP-type peptidyl-prolyl cis-trans isomerase 2
MISFAPFMKSEKVAIIALVIIIVGALSVYLGIMYGGDILSNFTAPTVKAEDDYVTFSVNSSDDQVNILTNDEYAKDKSVTIEVAVPPNHGSVKINGTDVMYTPDRSFLGNDTFTYKLIQQGTSREATVHIRISYSVIALGDCADIQYIGRYANNNTVFDSSYGDVETKTGGTPLQVFVTLDQTEQSPKSGYSTVIEGLAEGLVGMKEGDSGVIGPIPPEKAYGAKKLKVGDSFYTSSLALELNQTLEVTKLGTTFISLRWIDMNDLGVFTMPQMILRNLSSMEPTDMVLYPPPYYLWENATVIQSITEDSVNVFTTPTSTSNLVDNIEPIQFDTTTAFLFHDASTAEWDEDTITITNNPSIGASYTYIVDYYGTNMTIIFEVEKITNDSINVSILYEGSEEKLYQEVPRVLTFSRTFAMPRNYDNIPLMYQDMLFGPDLAQQGYSTSELAGDSLIFEVEIVKVYKTSQGES